MEPDFSVEVDSPDEVEVPQIVPRNVPLKPLEKPKEAPVEKAVEPIEKAVEPIEAPIEKPVETSSQLAETIEIEHPQAIFPHIEPYPETSPKQHHFHFKHKSDHTHLIQAWSSIGITVEFNESGKNNVDVTLMREGQLVGKIQFLHFDRRDRSIRSKHYVKVYLYQFEDHSMFERAKQIMRTFFQEIGSKHHVVHRSIRRSHKTRKLHKKRRSTKKRRLLRK